MGAYPRALSGQMESFDRDSFASWLGAVGKAGRRAADGLRTGPARLDASTPPATCGPIRQPIIIFQYNRPVCNFLKKMISSTAKIYLGEERSHERGESHR